MGLLRDRPGPNVSAGPPFPVVVLDPIGSVISLCECIQ